MLTLHSALKEALLPGLVVTAFNHTCPRTVVLWDDILIEKEKKNKDQFISSRRTQHLRLYVVLRIEPVPCRTHARRAHYRLSHIPSPEEPFFLIIFGVNKDQCRLLLSPGNDKSKSQVIALTIVRLTITLPYLGHF
ncbi:uncharacterized protein LOC120892322 isoform X2 [Ictidomys tridecemlineatus]